MAHNGNNFYLNADKTLIYPRTDGVTPSFEGPALNMKIDSLTFDTYSGSEASLTVDGNIVCDKITSKEFVSEATYIKKIEDSTAMVNSNLAGDAPNKLGVLFCRPQADLSVLDTGSLVFAANQEDVDNIELAAGKQASLGNTIVGSLLRIQINDVPEYQTVIIRGWEGTGFENLILMEKIPLITAGTRTYNIYDKPFLSVEKNATTDTLEFKNGFGYVGNSTAETYIDIKTKDIDANNIDCVDLTNNNVYTQYIKIQDATDDSILDIKSTDNTKARKIQFLKSNGIKLGELGYVNDETSGNFFVSNKSDTFFSFENNGYECMRLNNNYLSFFKNPANNTNFDLIIQDKTTNTSILTNIHLHSYKIVSKDGAGDNTRYEKKYSTNGNGGVKFTEKFTGYNSSSYTTPYELRPLTTLVGYGDEALTLFGNEGSSLYSTTFYNNGTNDFGYKIQRTGSNRYDDVINVSTTDYYLNRYSSTGYQLAHKNTYSNDGSATNSYDLINYTASTQALKFGNISGDTTVFGNTFTVSDGTVTPFVYSGGLSLGDESITTTIHSSDFILKSYPGEGAPAEFNSLYVNGSTLSLGDATNTVTMNLDCATALNINPSGIYMANLPQKTVSSSGFVVDYDSADGRLRYIDESLITSSKKYKDIINENIDTSFIYDISPKLFTYNNRPSKDIHFGIIAEELDVAIRQKNNNKDFGFISRNGDVVEGIRPRNIMFAMMAEMQKMDMKIKKLENTVKRNSEIEDKTSEIKELEKKNVELVKKLNSLETILQQLQHDISNGYY